MYPLRTSWIASTNGHQTDRQEKATLIFKALSKQGSTWKGTGCQAPEAEKQTGTTTYLLNNRDSLRCLDIGNIAFANENLDGQVHLEYLPC